MPVGNHGQFDIHSFFLHDLTPVLFQNTPSLISGIHLPLPIAVLHTEEQQILSATGFKIQLCAFGLSSCSWILPFWKSGVLLVVLGTWENLWLTRCQKETTLFQFLSGLVLNSRSRGAVRSSVIMVGASLLCEQPKHILYVRPRDTFPHSCQVYCHM